MKIIVVPFEDESCEPHWFSKEYFLFQVDYKFHLVIYPSSYNGYSHLDFKELVLNNNLKGKNKLNSKIERYSVEKIKEKIRDSSIFKAKVEEIIYTYRDNARKKYCFTLLKGFQETVIQKHEYSKEKDNAISVIDESDMFSREQKVWLKESVLELYAENSITLSFSYYDEIKLTDILAKQFIKKLKPIK